MSDRGEYRIFFASLADDPDFHALSGDAAKLLILLKLSLPATGLGVIYPSKLADQVNCDKAHLERLLAELATPKPGSDHGWIVRDRNVVWLVNALRFETNLTHTNVKKHVPYVRKLVATIDAKLPIVAAFKAYYHDWFDSPSNGNGKPIDRLSDGGSGKGIDRVSKPKHYTTTQDQDTSGDLGKERSRARATAESPAPLALAELHPEIVAFGARFYGPAPAARRREIAHQLLALANGEAITYRGAPVVAGSVDRLIAACRSIRALEKPDSAIAYLLTKLDDSADLTAAQVARDKAERETEERATAADVAIANTWLSDRPDLAAEIDAELATRGFATTSDDAYVAMCRGMMRRTLVLRAWRGATQLTGVTP